MGEKTKQKNLKKQLLDPKSVIHKMSAEEIHASDPRYSNYPIKKTMTNLRNLKQKFEATKAQAEFDNRAVADHQRLFPRKSLTKRGYPQWNNHSAKNIYKMMFEMEPQRDLAQRDLAQKS